VSDNQSYGTTPPDPNQDKNEPIGTSPETSAQAGDSAASQAARSGEASRASQDQGRAPRDAETDDAAGAEQMQRSASPPVDGGVPTPGDAQGVAVPSVQAAAATSEQSEKVDGVNITSIAPPGKPDGEVDTRPSAVSPSAGSRPSSTPR
jgi:hypothetical protein